MNYLLKYTFGAILMATLLTSFGCDSSNPGNTNEASFGTMEVWLHDDPADFDEVNIFVERVEVNNQADSDEGWVVINEPAKKIDLLKLTNGNVEVLGSAELETGTYSQIRLIASNDDSYIVENGQQKTLFIPSGEQSGLKLNIDAEITEGDSYILMLDFDVEHSIVSPGSSGQPADYMLKPVIRTASLAETGSVSGVVSQAGARAVVSAHIDSDVFSTTYADKDSGEFLLWLEEGTYTISFEPREDGYENRSMDEIEVTAGEDNDLGEIVLEGSGEE